MVRIYGVLIIDELDEAKTQLKDMLLGKFGESSKTVVVEEFWRELKCHVLFYLMEKNYKVLPYAKDYKRIGETTQDLYWWDGFSFTCAIS